MWNHENKRDTKQYTLGEEVKLPDAEAGQVDPEAIIVIYDLPWDGLREDQAKQLTKEVFALSADEDALLTTREELEYQFDFDCDQYIVLAQILLKMDKNLKKTRHSLVPDLVSEDEFWRNYFYKIECAKAELGV